MLGEMVACETVSPHPYTLSHMYTSAVPPAKEAAMPRRKFEESKKSQGSRTEPWSTPDFTVTLSTKSQKDLVVNIKFCMSACVHLLYTDVNCLRV